MDPEDSGNTYLNDVDHFGNDIVATEGRYSPQNFEVFGKWLRRRDSRVQQTEERPFDVGRLKCGEDVGDDDTERVVQAT